MSPTPIHRRLANDGRETTHRVIAIGPTTVESGADLGFYRRATGHLDRVSRPVRHRRDRRTSL